MGAPAVDPVSASIAGLQAAAGLVQTISASSKLKRKRAQRTAYQTPDEIFKILNATLNQAGGDTITRDFQTGQLDRSFSQILGGATRLGANPNDLSAIFDQKMMAAFKIGDAFHLSNLQYYDKVNTAYNLVAENRAAEWRSREDLIKDDMQALAAEKAAGIQNLGSAFNAGIGIAAAAKTSDLYSKSADALGG